MAGLMKESTSRKIILHDHFSFYAPDYIGIEIFRHREYLMKRSKLTEPDFDEVLRTLLSRVTLVPFEEFENTYPLAMQVMEPVDGDDAPFLAVGLALQIGGIWTEDRHFLRQDFMRVHTTMDLITAIERD